MHLAQRPEDDDCAFARGRWVWWLKSAKFYRRVFLPDCFCKHFEALQLLQRKCTVRTGRMPNFKCLVSHRFNSDFPNYEKSWGFYQEFSPKVYCFRDEFSTPTVSLYLQKSPIHNILGMQIFFIIFEPKISYDVSQMFLKINIINFANRAI